MRNKKQTNILVVLSMGSPAGSKQLAGIFRYVSNRTDWDVTLARNCTCSQIAGMNEDIHADGIITTLKDVSFLHATHRRLYIVQIDADEREATGADNVVTAHVRSDDFRAGVEGARHLLSLGRMRAYGYIPTENAELRWSRLRQKGYRDTLAERGLALDVFDSTAEKLGEWLQRLPKPAGIIAASDDIASKALITCHGHKIAVPQQIAILGHDNDSLICDNCRPRLSSVQIAHEEEGFAAAQMLDRIMRRSNQRSRNLMIPPGAVVVRESTRHVSPVSSLIDRGMVYIHENAAKGIKVDDVARHLNVSRRLLYLRFREQLGKSVLKVITERRINLLKSRLAATSNRIAALSLACGFPSANHAKRVFRAATGLTMREWCATRGPKATPHLKRRNTSRK